MGKRTANADEVSKRLRQLRLDNDIKSQDKLSELTGIPIISIRRYEEGKTVPEGKNLLKLASFYKVYPEYILGETDFMNSFDKWDQTLDVKQIKKELDFWETGVELGLFPEIKSDDEYEEFIDYLKQFKNRKEN